MPGPRQSFEFDVFISYAHDDDNKLVDEDVGWVSQFHKNFVTLLNEQLGRQPKIWRDSDITPNEDFERKIFSRLVKSAVFLPVVSKIFINRPYCLRELKTFVDNAEGQLATYVDGVDGERKRLFIVEKLQVDRQQLPKELHGLGGTYKFYGEGNQTLRPALSSKESGEGQLYYRVLNRLSKTVADLIELMQLTSGVPDAQRGLPVYLAETTSDLDDYRDTLRDDLSDRGFVVLPELELPRQLKRYSEVVRSNLERAVISVHLIGPEYGFIPEGEKELSNVRLQHQLALERSERDARFTQLVWVVEAGESVADGRQRDFLNYLQTDERVNSHAEVLEGDIEGVKTQLYEKLTAIKTAASAPKSAGEPVTRPVATAEAAHPLVYIICDKADRSSEPLKALRSFLFEQGCEARLPVEEGTQADILKAHADKLEEFDGFVIYHGAGSEGWLESQLADFRKYLRNRTKRVAAKAVVIAPPDTSAKSEFFTHEAAVVRTGDKFVPAVLEPFLAALRQSVAR
jgi:hypothetical protein